LDIEKFMILTQLDNGDVEVGMFPEDVESAIRHFICTCHPELATGFLINPWDKEAESKLLQVAFRATASKNRR
jgi:hypothetical protein